MDDNLSFLVKESGRGLGISLFSSFKYKNIKGESKSI